MENAKERFCDLVRMFSPDQQKFGIEFSWMIEKVIIIERKELPSDFLKKTFIKDVKITNNNIYAKEQTVLYKNDNHVVLY